MLGIDDISEKLEENFDDKNLDVNKLADELGVSRTSLWRYCNEHFKTSPKDLIDRYKLYNIIQSAYRERKHLYDVARNNGIESRITFYQICNRILNEPPQSIEFKIFSNGSSIQKSYLKKVISNTCLEEIL